MQLSLSRIFSALRLQLLAALVLSSATWGQGTYLVNRADPTAYQSITDAVNAATASGLSATVVQIEGLPDYLGLGLGYSQASTGESFPIQLPPGCTVKPNSSAAVFVWNSGGTVTALFEIGPSGGGPVVIENISFLGGLNAIYVGASLSGQKIEVDILDCRFSGSQNGITAFSSGGDLVIDVKDCTITDATVTSINPPVLISPRTGLRFHAQSGSTAGKVSATVVDLMIDGSFILMDPEPAFTAGLAVETTRLIEVWSEGDGIAKQHPGASSGDFTPHPITEVNLTVQGGNWVQNSSPAGGWDTAIHAEAFGGLSNPLWDYIAGFRVSVSGTVIDGFNEDGIYAGTYHSARGNIVLSSSTVIARTGKGQGFDETRHSGIHLHSWESYTGLEAGNTTFFGNAGNGVYAHTQGNFNGDETAYTLVAPMGLYLGLKKCKIHSNDGNGVLLKNIHPYQLSGFIGGTLHQDWNTKIYNIESDGEGFNVPHGQGVITQTSISNNGLAGIRVRAEGDDGNAQFSREIPSGAAIRVSNSFIWNNPMGGVDVDWVKPAPGLRAGVILVSVTNCTFVENGNGAGGSNWSMEINDHATSVLDRANFAWLEPNGANPYFMRTVVWNSIFTRGLGLLVDFGPLLNQGSLNPFSVIDKGPSQTTLFDYQVGFAGTRGKGWWGGLTFSTSAMMTDEATVPFVGPLNVTLLNPAQFHLIAGPTSPMFVNKTPSYERIGAPETAIDFGGQVRPGPTTGLRDKGADEL